jgi:pimeloyl-ACP methyl ester carboxylesterase
VKFAAKIFQFWRSIPLKTREPKRVKDNMLNHPPITPPDFQYEDFDLPNTRLHTVKSGTGPPLIIVPAAVSLIRQWLPLTQFMGQRFTAHFFELPGHGGSTPYPVPFTSQLVPKTVEALADTLGYERFSLMGFSFGGLLALRTLEHLQKRIDRVILLSPVVSQRALKYSTPHRMVYRAAARALMRPRVQRTVHRVLHAERLEAPLLLGISKFSKVKRSILESKDALRIPQSTLDVLAYTLDEIFSMEYRSPNGAFQIPCFFGMSVHDDLLRYDLTESIVRNLFSDLTIRSFTHPYHQPPHPPTFEWLVQDFGSFLDVLDR